MSFRSLDDADVKGKRVLVRVDLNVPMNDGELSDTTRIERTAPTIKEIADRGGKVILLSHFGRPKGRDPRASLKRVAAAAARIVGRPIAFADDCVGEVAEAAVAAMKPGDILCLENTRFHAGEEKNDPAFVAALAKLGDIYVNDAFSVAHRANASTEGLGHKLPAYAGRAMQAELEALEKALHAPQRPVAAIVGGAKISTKLDLLGNLLAKVDTLIIGGGMANTFLAAQGKAVGKSLCETRPHADRARHSRQSGRNRARDRAAGRCRGGAKAGRARALARRPGGRSRLNRHDPRYRAADDRARHLGSGPQQDAGLERPLRRLRDEPFDNGTIEVAEAAAELTAAGKLVSIAGGGDTMAALNAAGVTARFTYASTAGGAFLEWLEGKALPGVEVLKVPHSRCDLRMSHNVRSDADLEEGADEPQPN